MDIERGNLELLFKKMPYSDIPLERSIEKKNSWKYLEQKKFINMSADIFPSYTNDERENIYRDLMKRMEQPNGVFGYLQEMSKKLLCKCDDEVKCQYSNILRWREISFQLGQDLFTCAYLAADDIYKRTQFSWRPIIQSNNLRLHNILAKGMSENHFHLNGSTQIMELNWISLMNFVGGRKKEFEKLKLRLSTQELYETTEKHEDSLEDKCRKAALYRALLFEKVSGIIMDEEKLTAKEISLQEESWKIVDLENRISTLRHMNTYRDERGFVLDYCLSRNDFKEEYQQYRILCGERKLLYQCFWAINAGELNELYCNIFYRYLILKNDFREEMIQVNRRVGFQNFSEYQDRKETFIEKYPSYCKEAIRLAIHATMREQVIDSLEARIGPAPEPNKLRKKIKFNTNIIDEQDEKEREKTFFVIHFPKSKKDEFVDTKPRNSRVRNSVKDGARAIAKIKFTSEGDKIRGIDTCSNENGCRPEVFGQAFRFLADYRLSEAQRQLQDLNRFVEDDKDKRKHARKSFKLTYHVGEDFIDITDGLRAIDEAILFCGLRRGDRIGHALALGIEPANYYPYKNQKLIMPKQDLLDNLTWFLEKTSMLELNEQETQCRNSIRNTFVNLCQELYGEYLSSLGCASDEHVFYRAWTLRGDKPEFYLDYNELDKILEHKVLLDVYDKYGINSNSEIDNAVRKLKDTRELYYAYHFDRKVREKGSELITFKIIRGYADIVRKLQDMMIRNIVERGIAIESNPSSNYLIGTIQKYEEHPMIRFNSRKLKQDAKNAICVSINTDDQGVFDTYLENEYALMARALEKAKDENGESIYGIEDIYEWLDYVRKMGNEQSFK